MASSVRVRFAPSPTGLLHIGAARTALYDWLFAKQQNGTFILRIEDTDKAREVEGAIDNIEQSLLWLGLQWQETYKQSDRLELYRKYAQKLVDDGRAYADPYTPAEVEKFRKQATKAKQPFLFRNFRPEQPPKWDGTLPLRFKVKDIKSYRWRDEVRGELSAGPEALDDIILIKSDGYPTYNFAHIVDDHLMEISHVTRGDEFIASLPKYLAIYEALGWKPPKFVTLPPILARGGGKKLSKREGAQAVLEYRDQGYLPEAVNNFLALLGWNDGTKQEIYTTNELVKKFAVDRIQKSSAKFEAQHLDWINAQHLRNLDLAELANQAETFWPGEAKKAPTKLKHRLLEIEQERLKRLDELKELPSYFFQAPQLTRRSLELLEAEFQHDTDSITLKDWLSEVKSIINKVGDTNRQKLEDELRKHVEAHPGNSGGLFSILRVVLTDADKTPPIWDIVYVIGKNEAVRRLESAEKLLN